MNTQIITHNFVIVKTFTVKLFKNCVGVCYNVDMIKAINCPALSAALNKLKEIISRNESEGKRTIIFCEDRLTLAAERTVCAAVGGTFSVSVYTFARFLSSERGKNPALLSSQGSAMAIRKIIEENKDKLKLFGKFSAAASAGAVYDTIALLYSSKISAADVAEAAASGLLESKLHDIAIIYSEYTEYLKESGKVDRNAYLSELPSVIEKSKKIAGSEVVFLGFQSFTRSSTECLRAAFSTAPGVYGLFIGGEEEIYVNEGSAAYISAAKEFGGAEIESAESPLVPEAELLRKSLFEPLSFFGRGIAETGNVHIFEATDEDEELEFIAASIKKHVLDNDERYAKISVMLPDVAGAERDIRRVFSQYRIPYYADMRHVLGEHPVCSFILNYLGCVLSGCSPKDTDGVISSPMFPAELSDKDEYRNYALRLAAFRGGIKREPSSEITAAAGFDIEAVERVRKTFLRGLNFLPPKGDIPAICAGVRKILEDFGAEEKLKNLAEKYRDEYPAASAFSARVYEGVLNVLTEAEEIASGVPLKEFVKILKSGFNAFEISLIPPKADAVFVGDIGATANTGSNVVFAARLTGDVPGAGDDTALLTDREIAALEEVNLEISPKIRQVNLRRREMIALNICAFKKHLYLSYPVRLGGEESGTSEIISYAQAIFRTRSGGELKPLDLKRLEKSALAVPYYCSEKLPALKRLFSREGETAASVYGALKNNGLQGEADFVLSPSAPRKISDGRSLFAANGSVSPTALETYFSCPFKNFMQQGLRLKEREEGAMRPLDTGNFIHAVLQEIAPELGTFKDEKAVSARAEELASKLLSSPAYSALKDSESGEYVAAELVKEAGKVSAGAYEQLKNSRFEVEKCESKCEINLGGGLKIGGRIDRVDSFADMVRIIDYKTGTIDVSAPLYYMGLKLQLPLYLSAASVGRRAVGAYYFPASLEFKPKEDGVFRLRGFMDGSREVVSASDTTMEPQKKSAYFDAYLDRKNPDGAMDGGEFSDFLKYSVLVANCGSREMLGGNIQPSPVADACAYCKMGGSCGFSLGVDGAERKLKSVKCSDVAQIVRKERGDE